MKLIFKKKWSVEDAPKGALAGKSPLSIRVNKQNVCFLEFKGIDLKQTPFKVKSKVAVIKATNKQIILYECE